LHYLIVAVDFTRRDFCEVGHILRFEKVVDCIPIPDVAILRKVPPFIVLASEEVAHVGHFSLTSSGDRYGIVPLVSPIVGSLEGDREF
jgi:hypothetical protein